MSIKSIHLNFLILLAYFCGTVPSYSSNEHFGTPNVSTTEHCYAEWNKFWPLAKMGDRKALSRLAENIPTLGLNPPGQPTDDIGWKRTFFILGLHGYNSDSKMLQDMIPSMLRSFFISQPIGEKIYQCLAKNPDDRTCIKYAVDENIVPSLDHFVQSIVAAENSSLTVYCAR